jgi:hypothetical protein
VSSWQAIEGGGRSPYKDTLGFELNDLSGLSQQKEINWRREVQERKRSEKLQRLNEEDEMKFLSGAVTTYLTVT